jgi:hypothetical protein
MKDASIQQSVHDLQQQLAVVNALIEDLAGEGIRVEVAMKERNSHETPPVIVLRQVTQTIDYLDYT